MEIMQNNEGTGRIEAFSDGVFAVAITLLVLDIKVPNHTVVNQYGLVSTLINMWPSYLAFATSFLSILVIWVKHHWMFTLIERTDHAFLYWNGLLLSIITLLPFPTALLVITYCTMRRALPLICTQEPCWPLHWRFGRCGDTHSKQTTPGHLCHTCLAHRDQANHTTKPLWPAIVRSGFFIILLI
jgi:hypothetical protein